MAIWFFNHWAYVLVIGIAIIYFVVLALVLIPAALKDTQHKREIKDLHSKHKHELTGRDQEIAQLRSSIEHYKEDFRNRYDKLSSDSNAAITSARTEADERIKNGIEHYEKLVKYLEYRGLRWHLEL
jgi:hypothetical protein